ncbi:MAG: alpha/beta family hydrolase [Myxococcota bacterium]
MAGTSSATPLRFLATESQGEVSALLLRPDGADRLLVFAHGAGADMHHAFMQAAAERLADRGLATFRYQFPFMEGGRRGPNPPAILTKTVRSAVDAAHAAAPDLPLFAGGKSLGGRMTSTAASAQALPRVRGLVFFGFPLHAPGKPSSDRGAHLHDVAVPLLFLQGTRDKLADLELLAPLVGELGPAATLHVVDGGDHSFHVLKRSGRNDDEVLDELADAVDGWTAALA